ncbi:MAG: L-threonylcarbamoyladenylate synthase [Thermoanaerobaculia bacterium]|nr:L-threonylcarbamoyladenylate synthase [Thermoanaerobaculia bacterium]
MWDESQVLRWRWGDDPAELVGVLEHGGVVAIPSESSYGLAVVPWNHRGVEAVYRIKGRDRGKPLPVVAADAEQLRMVGVDPTAEATRFVARHWPAALTLVAPLEAADQDMAAAAGGATLAVRVPAHERLRDLLRYVGCPWTATSANASGDPPILRPDALPPLFQPLLGHLPVAVVDDGELPGGPPSTLVAWEPESAAFRVLRSGRVDVAGALPLV